MRWKLTAEYHRQQQHYGRWVKAIEAMLTQCNPAYAPWTVVEAEDLHWAKVRVLETVVNRLDQALQLPAPQSAARARRKESAQPKPRRVVPMQSPGKEGARKPTEEAIE